MRTAGENAGRRWRGRIAAAAATVALAVGLVPVDAPAATLPAGFTDTVALSGLVNPSAVRFAPDGRVFVAEKRGVVKVYDGLADTTATVVADLRTNVYNFWDRGLLGLALDPDLATRPYVYVLYTFDAPIGGTAPRWGTAGADSDPCPTIPGATADGCVVSGRLSRFQIGPDSVMTGGEQVLIEDWCQQYPSHSIGSLAFGSDKQLYVSGGDGASFNFVDYGQDGAPLNPCGDPPVPVGGTQTAPSAQGGALRSQDLRSSGDPVGLDGAILRVDPNTGAASAGNPFASSSDPNARRIIASGLRNPFRIGFRPGTDELWAGDVGWTNWEEMNLLPDANDAVAENFGWPCYEGTGRQAGYDSANLTLCEQLYSAGGVTAPAYSYNHANKVVTGETCPTGSSSVSGIAFKATSGGSYPASYNGAAFMADYSRDCIWVMTPGASGRPDFTTRRTFLAGAANPVDVQIGPSGDLFYVDFDNGTIHRVVYGTTGPALCPTGQFSAEYFNNRTLTPARSSTRCESSVAYDWGSGAPDGTGVAADNFSVRWTGTFAFSAGTFRFTTRADDGVRLWLDDAIVIDNWVDQSPTTRTAERDITAGQHVVRIEYYENGGGATASAGWEPTVVNDAPIPVIGAPLATATWQVGDQIAFSGSAADTEDGALPAASLSWSVVMHHCPSNCHTHPIQDFPGVTEGTFTAQDHEYPAHLEFRLTATDSGGRTGTVSVLVYPRTVPITFQTSPPGLQLAVGSTAGAAPFTRTVIVGSTNSVSAPSPQSLGGVPYLFSSWSDGGAGTHFVIGPPSATTYTATYTLAPDTNPPAISNVRVTTTASSATITWTTSEPADSRIDYGRSSALGSSTPVATTLVTSHSRRLTGLARFTLYYYRITSRDALGNTATSALASFRTNLL